jgi:cardiolipin synthase
MHQKVFLIDDQLAGIGSTNLDNRSLHINFEITALIADTRFAEQVEQMLLADFAGASVFEQATFEQKPFWFRLAVKAANLTAPML